ncbi:glutamine synthetase family protein [Mesorhizobium sp. VK9D]|uniref:glutamine synthetase family protein n=1 Tax=Mesorhizobium australafricanum TaxID=3072311 RepID=UPI002A249DE3|nr:glutamine synthetase family protein [Mesorhizobium sp. VK9D]MDX8454867.1 glutamine synthetase family protein [Mesorhizobium sp. VK9D]
MPDNHDSSIAGADPQSWLKTHAISEVECLVPDVNGVLRGKTLPVAKFLKSLDDRALYLPSSAFLVAIDGRYSGSIDEGFAYSDPDMRMVPDVSSLCLAPGSTGRAYVFADTFHMDDRPWMASPRHVLRDVLDLYRQRGWRAVMAPELEFYLTAPNPNPDQPLTAPIGRNGRPESVQHPYDMQALEEFEAVTRRLYEHAAIAGLPVETLIHESGTAQLEINLLHGDPLALADKVLLFKRLARQAAQASGMHATFMAKPIAAQAGSSMHLHMSIVDEAGEPLFAGKDGEDTRMFAHFIGGLQKYIPEIMPLFAPNVNSYRRVRPNHSAPANIEWSHDNRSCGLRVPMGGRAARRIENRLPGADANPYLAMAGSLIAGYLGIEEKLARSEEAFGNAYRSQSTLPKTMEEALDRFAACEPVRALLGEDFFQTYLRVKSVELDLFQSVVTSWERDHLLLKV